MPEPTEEARQLAADWLVDNAVPSHTAEHFIDLVTDLARLLDLVAVSAASETR